MKKTGLANQGERHKKNGYHTATTTYPCSIPSLGEFSRSWLYPSDANV